MSRKIFSGLALGIAMGIALLTGCTAGAPKPVSTTASEPAPDPTGYVAVLGAAGIHVEPVLAEDGTTPAIADVEGWTTSREDGPGGALALSSGPRGESGFIPNILTWVFEVAEPAEISELIEALRAANPGADVTGAKVPGDERRFIVSGTQFSGEVPLVYRLYGLVTEHNDKRFLTVSQLSATTADAETLAESIDAVLPSTLTVE